MRDTLQKSGEFLSNITDLLGVFYIKYAGYIKNISCTGLLVIAASSIKMKI